MGGPHDYYTEDTGGSWGGGEDFGSPFSGNNSPPATSNEGGNNNWNSNNNNNPWSGNDWANEFVDTGVTVPYDAHAGSSVNNLPNDYTYEGDYVPWQTSPQENFLSAFGGLGTYGENNDQYAWNPFIAGFDKEGKPIYLTTSQFNEMMSVGEFGILPPGGTTGGGPGPGGGGGRGGGYRSGSGGRGGVGSGGSFMQSPGAEGGNPHRPPWGKSDLHRRWINQLRGYNRGGIVSLC